MKAINPLQLLAVAVLYSLMAALILFIAWTCRPKGGEFSPNGLTARTAAVSRLQQEITGR
jgi:hypothetical protein